MAEPFHLLFTDLDGTLLDEATYGFEPALPAIRALQARGIPIVFCTSKTFAETAVIQEDLGISDPIIVENGGAIYFRPGQVDPTGLTVERRGAWNRLSLGVPYRALVAQLGAIQERSGVGIRAFSAMEPGEIATECGLSVEAAERAKLREFDEPFRFLDGSPDDHARFARMVQGIGLSLTSGGRYFHLSGISDKGRAVRRLCEFLRKSRGPLRTVGIGDSLNDLPMLQAVDQPVIVQRPNGQHHADLQAGVPHALLAPGAGPVGWNAAVLTLLSGEAMDGA